jgi:glycyl-tRNA synthetase beta chain
LGLINIILASGLDLSLRRLLDLSLAQFTQGLPREKAEVATEVHAFIWGRLRGIASEAGVRPEAVEAVGQTGEDSLARLMARARSVTDFAARPEFADLLTGYTRAANLVSKAEVGGESAPSPRPDLYQEEAERELAAAVAQRGPEVAAALARQAWSEALTALAELRAPIDAFFTAVMVMAEDSALRANRLALLGQVVAIFRQVAEFASLG